MACGTCCVCIIVHLCRVEKKVKFSFQAGGADLRVDSAMRVREKIQEDGLLLLLNKSPSPLYFESLKE